MSATAGSATSVALSESTRPLRAISIPQLPLDGGEVMRDVRIAYHLDGALTSRRDNVVLVLHALTGTPDAAGDWWRAVIGAQSAIDTTRWAVLAPNLLGSCYGTTGPRAGETLPAITVRDQARAIALLLERLAIPRVALVTGGSLGGMVALEFAASFPGRVERAVVFAAPARLGAAAIAWSHTQREALRIGGEQGLALARAIAMISYRSAVSFAGRFDRRHGPTGAFAVQEWLAHHGSALTARFTAESYGTLLDVMDSHDVGADRGGIGERLRASGTRFTGVGIPGDLFCPPQEVASWVNAAGGEYREIDSVHGHDAFLIEQDQVAAILSTELAAIVAAASSATPFKKTWAPRAAEVA